MTEWTALSRADHADHHYQPREGYHAATEQIATPILLGEVSRLLADHVLAFIAKDAEYQAVALLGLESGQNVYVHADGRWLGHYVPASLRGYPFTLIDTKNTEKALCIVSECLSQDEGEPLFDQAGELAPPVQKMLDFLTQCAQNRQLTQHAVDALNQAGVIEPWHVTLAREEGQDPLTAKGLFRVSETALNALDASTYHSLRGSPMALAHAQLFSMAQLGQLARRAADYSATPSSTAPKDPNRLLWEDDNLLIRFDS